MPKFLIPHLMVILFTSGVNAQEPSLITNYFQESISNFCNPERGFHHYTHLESLSAGDVGNLREQGITLILGKVDAEEFRNATNLSLTFLNQIRNGFELARANGLKVNFRMTYTNEPDHAWYLDAPKNNILNHIQQLGPVWEANKDVINLVEAGFIGPWGEWHSSNLANTEDERDILQQILTYLPSERMVVVREPVHKRNIYTNSSTPGGYESLDVLSAFSKSMLARTGFHNDCFLSSPDDVGTYITPGWSRNAEIAYIGNETLYTPFGGETCALSDESFCSQAIDEMERLHASYLNMDYDTNVIIRWRSSGCLEEIKRRLGYRFILQKSAVSEEVKPGGILNVRWELTNAGFASPFNERPVRLVLFNSSTTQQINMLTDLRWWHPKKKIILEKSFRIPSTMQTNRYSIAMYMPDTNGSLMNDSRYSIRLANEGIWTEPKGWNVIMTNLHVTSNAPGNFEVSTSLTEISGFSIGYTLPPISRIQIVDPDGVNDVSYGKFSLKFKINTERITNQVWLYASQSKDGKNGGNIFTGEVIGKGYHSFEWNMTEMDSGYYYITGIVKEISGEYFTNTAIYPVLKVSTNDPSFLCYPNPFTPSKNKLKISFKADVNDSVEFYVYDMEGKYVSRILEQSDQGWLWDGKNDAGNLVSQGLYIVKMRLNGKFLKSYFKVGVKR